MQSKRLLASFAILTALHALASGDGIVFQSYTEEPTAGWGRISEALARRLVISKGIKDYADQCIHDDALARNYRQFLVTRPAPLSTGQEKYFLVRPTADPNCHAFYGAHVFTFWIVDSRQRIVFSATADEFTVLKTSHKGMRDLLVSQCHGGYCYRSTLAFDAHSYQAMSCATVTIATEESVPGCQP